MLDLIKIMNEINKVIVKKYPNLVVYVNKVPKDFERPSFFIQYVASTQDTINKDTIKEKVFFTITYFSEVDEYYNTDKLDLNEVLVEILKVFRVGYIKVEGRAITINASSGGSSEDEAYIDLQVEYCEDRLEDGNRVEDEANGTGEYETIREINNIFNLRRG